MKKDFGCFLLDVAEFILTLGISPLLKLIRKHKQSCNNHGKNDY